MSKTKSHRAKVGYYTVRLVDPSSKAVKSPDPLIKLITKIGKLPDGQRAMEEKAQSRFFQLADVKPIHEGTMMGLTFETARTQWRPDLIRPIGARRRSPKQLDEAECELVHMLLRKHRGDVIQVLLEERPTKMGLRKIIDYFSYFDKQFNGGTRSLAIESQYIPRTGFLENLRSAARIRHVEFELPITSLDRFAAIHDQYDAVEHVKLIVTAKKKMTIARITERVFPRTEVHDSNKIERIRAYGKRSDGVDMLLDTLGMKKNEFVDVMTDPNTDQVNSASIFLKLEPLFDDFG